MRFPEHHPRSRATRLVALAALAVTLLTMPGGTLAAAPAYRLVGADGFDRVVMDGWSGGALDYAFPDGSTGFATDGQSGTILVWGDGRARQVEVDGLVRRDVDIRFRVTIDALPAHPLHLTTVARRSAQGELRARLVFRPDGRLVLGSSRARGGRATALGPMVPVADLRVAPGVPLEVRVRVANSGPTFVGIRVWPSGTTQPRAWMLHHRDRNDELVEAGMVGLTLRADRQPDAEPVLVRIDDLAVRVARPRPRPLPTPTPDRSPAPRPDPTRAPRPDPTVEPAPTAEPVPDPTPRPDTPILTVVGDLVARDRFERVVTAGWSGPGDGATYALSGQVDDYAVDGDAGIVRLDRGTSRVATAIGARARDIDLSFRLRVDRLPVGGSVYAYGIVRRTAAGAEYRLKLRIDPRGAVHLQATRRVDGRESDIGREVRIDGLLAVPGTDLVLRARVTGSWPTVLRMRAWQAGDGPTKGWPYIGTDAQPGLQSHGQVGLMAYTGAGVDNGPLTLAFDDLEAVVAEPDLVPPAPEPTGQPKPTVEPEPTLGPAPTAGPTAHPDPAPTAEPTAQPDPAPTSPPAPVPSLDPTPAPTPVPTLDPTPVPTPVAPTTPAPTAPAPTAPPDRASTYHVATGGSDANPGTQDAPWRTLQKAADTVPSGAVVIVHPGSYAGFTVRRGGDEGDPTVFRGDPSGERPVLDGALDGRVDVVRLAGVHDVRIQHFEIVNAQGGSFQGAGVRTDSGAARIVIADNVIHDNRSYGVLSHASTQVTIRDNEIHGNEQGIEIRYAGAGTRIIDNHIHHQDRMLRNTVGGNDDSGASAIGFVRSTGAVLASGNRIHDNRAASHDYGWDGGAFEIYGASNVTIADNVVWNNENVLETGTDSGLACADNRFVRNVAWGGTTIGRSFGLFLRCAERMLVANNTLVDLDGFAFSLGSDSRTYSGRTDGLRIVNNIIDLTGSGAKAYGLVTWLPGSARIDDNLARTSGTFATLPDGRRTSSLATFSAWTGYDTRGDDHDPRFADRDGHEYMLRAGSPAIDTGAVIADVSDVYSGGAPDRGRFERLD